MGRQLAIGNEAAGEDQRLILRPLRNPRLAARGLDPNQDDTAALQRRLADGGSIAGAQFGKFGGGYGAAGAEVAG